MFGLIQSVLVIGLTMGLINGSPVGGPHHLRTVIDDGDSGIRMEDKSGDGPSMTIGQLIEASYNDSGDVIDDDVMDDEDSDIETENGTRDRGSMTIGQLIEAANNGNDDVMGEDDMADEEDGNVGHEKRALAKRRLFWPNGTIPYTITERLSRRAHRRIRKFMDMWENATCIRFVPAPNVTQRMPMIKIFYGRGCNSFVGRAYKNRPQTLSLGKDCVMRHVVLHELGHALGLYHEQSSVDRDDYITVHREYIKKGWKGQFNKRRRTSSLDLGVAYDYRSIMHYGQLDFANGSRVITTKDPAYQNKIGTYQYLSFGDVKSINLAYNCSGHCTDTDPCPGDGFRNKDCQCMCRDVNDPSNRHYIRPCPVEVERIVEAVPVTENFTVVTLD